MQHTSEVHKRDSANQNESLDRELDMYYDGRAGKTVKAEARKVLRTQGSYVAAKWAKRWDFVTAGYLAHFVAYAGSQKDPAGWIFKSHTEITDETGLTRRQQDRARKVLKGEQVIQTKTEGIGNKVHVRVNIPMLQLMDDLPSAEDIEADEAAGAEDQLHQSAEDLHVSAEDLHEDDEGLHISANGLHQNAKGLHRSAQPIPSTSRNTHQHPSTSVRRDDLEHVSGTARRLVLIEGKKDEEKIRKCVDLLRERVDFDAATLTDIIHQMAEEYAELDPVAIAKRVVEHGARHIERPGYFETCFRKAEAQRQDGDESCSVGAYAKAERSKDKPKRADVYASIFDVDIETVQSWIDDGLGDTDIMTRLER